MGKEGKMPCARRCKETRSLLRAREGLNLGLDLPNTSGEFWIWFQSVQFLPSRLKAV